jgi:hypothetical protein
MLPAVAHPKQMTGKQPGHILSPHTKFWPFRLYFTVENVRKWGWFIAD